MLRWVCILFLLITTLLQTLLTTSAHPHRPPFACIDAASLLRSFLQTSQCPPSSPTARLYWYSDIDFTYTCPPNHYVIAHCIDTANLQFSFDPLSRVLIRRILSSPLLYLDRWPVRIEDTWHLEGVSVVQNPSQWSRVLYRLVTSLSCISVLAELS